ncbi:MAG: hypothetical protein KDJ82_01165, partial [Rhodobacteraceae bacterium]|nr:hypothetical protein [Paracoccaceae bacterium]
SKRSALKRAKRAAELAGPQEAPSMNAASFHDIPLRLYIPRASRTRQPKLSCHNTETLRAKIRKSQPNENE